MAHTSPIIYSMSDTASGIADKTILEAEINAVSFTIPFSHVELAGDYIHAIFKNDLPDSPDEKPALTTVISAHNPPLHMVIDESSGYDENIYNGKGNLTNAILWTTSDKTRKIREITVTYSGSKISTSTTEIYDEYGLLKETIVETMTYSGSKLISISRSKT